jgi:putative phosphoesterase
MRHFLCINVGKSLCKGQQGMRILVISDTHGKRKGMEEIQRREGEVDALIHLGDIEGTEAHLDAIFDCPKYLVRGNNDFFSSLPEEIEFSLGSYKVWATHGHSYHINMGPEWLIQEGKAREADIVMFGHTHRPYLKKYADIIALNPGSVSYPRQEGRKGSYMIMEIDSENQLSFDQKYL